MLKIITFILLSLSSQDLASGANETTIAPASATSIKAETTATPPVNESSTPSQSNQTTVPPKTLHGQNSTHTKSNGATVAPPPQPPITLTPLVVPTTKKHARSEKCEGWCFKSQKIHNRAANLITNETADDVLIVKFAKMRSAVEKYPQFSVRAGENLFADKDQYTHFLSNRQRGEIFRKNVVKIPTMLFYPYTRRMIKDTIASSGNIFVPQKKMKPSMSRITRQRRRDLNENPSVYRNFYFDSNPLLHGTNKTYKSPQRRTHGFRRRFRDPYNIDSSRRKHKIEDLYHNHRRQNRIQLRVANLNQFMSNNFKERSLKRQSNLETDQVLGQSKELDTIMQPPENDVNDIVGAMKIGDQKGTFIIGTTKQGRSKINQWVGKKARSGTLPNVKGTGVMLSGKTRSEAINTLLRSMVLNYQYGDKNFVYKKTD